MLFKREGAQELIGMNRNIQDNVTIPDLSGTKWRHVFVESRGPNRKLSPNTKFLFCKHITNYFNYESIYGEKQFPTRCTLTTT